MDISKWPIDKVMQLPDWCFGRRWVVSAARIASGAVTNWDMSELTFPNRGVIWQVDMHPVLCGYFTCYYRLALGFQLPTTTGQMDLLSPLLNGLGDQGNEPRKIRAYSNCGQYNLQMRNPVDFQGKRLILEVTSVADKQILVNVGVVVSTIPKEIPDWLSSGLAGLR